MDKNIIPHDLWTTKLRFDRILGGEDAQQIADALDEAVLAVLLHNRDAADGDDWEITLTTLGPPDEAEILARAGAGATLSAEKLPERDWLRHVHDNFPPVRAGRFFIYGSHYEGQTPAELIPLKIDAATAFGSGEHETTRGCLQALEFLKGEGLDFTNALDMGCGSGILAIAFLKLWPKAKVFAVDIDPESVTVTRRHAEMNGAVVPAIAGDGYNAPEVAQRGPYDIILANILANPLIEMAPALERALKPGGYAVLSGLLSRQRDEVIAAHEAVGLTLIRAEEIGTPETGLWQALALRKAGG